MLYQGKEYAIKRETRTFLILTMIFIASSAFQAISLPSHVLPDILLPYSLCTFETLVHS
jgi:hypothetical protein